MKRPLTLVLWLLLARSGMAASISTTVKLDNFGYRSADTKIAYFTSNPGTVEVRRTADDSLAYAVPGASVTDKLADTSFTFNCYTAYIDNDHVWWADFSALTELGRFYVVSTTLNIRSYDFQVQESIYLAPMLATLKALYLQRCGTAHPATYAGNWADSGVCHPNDAAVSRACGTMTNYGTLDLSGGWHDAGDYNKYIGNTSVCGYNWNGDSGETLWYLMSAYELNPSVFYDGQGNIPESGNGIPDILDECKWELDWYLKMKMTDNHVLSVVHAENYTGGSPVSTDTTRRYYFADLGATTVRTEAIWVAAVARGARIFEGWDATYAATLKAAALAVWTNRVAGSASSEEKFWAAAEVFRMDPTVTAAKTFVDGYKTWSSYNWVPFNSPMSKGIVTYVQASGATAATVTGMKSNFGSHVNDAFNLNDHYNSGIAASDYYWSSNQVKSDYGMALIWGVKIGATGSHTSAQCLAHAEDFLHYLNGANPMNMVYMSGTQDIGGVGMGAKHGIYHLYHGWFGAYSDASSLADFIGKPSGVTDPLYPYYAGTDNFGINDAQTSNYGPAPGFVVDGPSHQYYSWGCGSPNGLSRPPNLPGGLPAPFAKAYRDWNWVDSGGNQSVPWIVNETGIYYTSCYTLLASQFMAPPVVGTYTQTPTFSVTPTRTATRTSSPTATPTRSPTASLSPSPTASPSRTVTPSQSPSATRSPTAGSMTFSPTESPVHSPTASPSVTLTFTATPSPSSTPTHTETPSVSPSCTPSSTWTASPTHSDTPSATPSSTVSSSSTGTPTKTGTRTLSPSFTQSPTWTTTPTPSATPSETPSSTATPVLSPTSSFTPGPPPVNVGISSLPGAIHSYLPSTDPNPVAISFQLEGDLDSVELKAYSKAMVFLGSSKLGPQSTGWRQVLLPLPALGLSNGLYYYVITGERSGKAITPCVGRYYILR